MVRHCWMEDHRSPNFTLCLQACAPWPGPAEEGHLKVVVRSSSIRCGPAVYLGNATPLSPAPEPTTARAGGTEPGSNASCVTLVCSLDNLTGVLLTCEQHEGSGQRELSAPPGQPGAEGKLLLSQTGQPVY